ncbi:peptidoglycan D,D-transpeptidase FtsI family protein [Pseudogracilibacillus auburnensis]|uniref:serine-type D-Ala-D-Ala carboxypeptidase n=1 Tax=Pseudogracilibacillus auburnensis TaxID=1494959 RepID=A0A2V3W031_9BACI|nr:penicillin-binding protein 2 [Pseudogracilibacillus auburnensis]PXW86501.1 cell elongation-specific peptidoglycan D,D-transpeptidase [Pseudogracilibacillus auburnensis]
MDKKKNKESRVPFRLNILFFIVFILFSILVLQLGIVQILQGESFQEEIDRTIQDTSRSPVPRGKMFDRNGEVVVDNQPLYSITYTPPKRVQAEDKLKLAKKLTNFITMEKNEIKKITEHNKKEYWYLNNVEKAVERLTDNEIEKLDDVEQYKLALKRITEEDISDFTDEDLQIIAIKRQLDKAYALTPEVIKNKDITVKEYAKIAEHLSDLPGINATTDWERQYKYNDTIKSIIGSITSQDQGIPAEKEDYYLTRGYNRNDRVGKSGLEEQYEDVLRGRKEQVQYTTTKTGNVIGSDIVVDGERGKDLVLSLDMEYQELADEILLKELKAAKGRGNYYLEDVLAIVLNPKTGEILALSGQHYNKETNEYENTPHKVLYDAHRPGSTVKGATVLAGLQSGVITPGQYFTDSPIKIADTPLKGSYKPLGSVDDSSALKLSSNVYMFYIGLRMAGEYRYPFPSNAKAALNPEGMRLMRNYFNQFGLGLSTGVDFPFESTGYVGPDSTKIMDLAIGQYDTYTTLQLGQYVATIANDGKRVQPHLVKEIRNPSVDNELGSVYKVNHPNVLNEIDIDPSYVKRVQTGFWRVFNEVNGTGYRNWAGNGYGAVGKTGTAENEVYLKRDDGSTYRVDVENLALVGYAPYDDPEVAFAVIVPQLTKKSGADINHKIGRQLLDTYFKLKENRSSSGNDGEMTDDEEQNEE